MNKLLPLIMAIFLVGCSASIGTPRATTTTTYAATPAVQTTTTAAVATPVARTTVSRTYY